jgi:hypothetical protein
MEAFAELRRQARLKRDKAIDQARRDYAETLARIAGLEQDLLGREMSGHHKISACIERVIPTDREFTAVDILTGLEAMDPGRIWRKRSVDSHISRLRKRGIVRRISRSRGSEPAVYARLGVQVAPRPFQDMTMREVIRTVLAEKPLTQTELVVAMLESGYYTTMTRQALRNAVGMELRKDGEFRKADGKWTLSE